MKYTSEDINIIIKAIKDYTRIVGIIKSYKDSDTSYEDLRKDLIKINGISLIDEEIEKKFNDSNNLIINGFLDFYYYDMILTIQVDDNIYELVSSIQVIDKDGSCIEDVDNVEELEKIFHDYVWSRIDNYVNKIDNEVLKQDYTWYKANTKEDLKQAIFESVWSCNGNDLEVMKEVNKFDNFVKMQEMKKEKKHTSYDLEVMLYLALEIKEILYNEKHFFIDIYCEEIKKIYEDFEKHDDANMSLLDSINKYIDENKESIKERFKDAFDTF